MFTPKAFLVLSASIVASAGFAGPSSRHSVEAVDHSGQALSHGSAAAISGGAAIASVPIIAFGSALTISGAALEEVGAGALTVGSEMSNIATHGVPMNPGVTPHGPPTLD